MQSVAQNKGSIAYTNGGSAIVASQLVPVGGRVGIAVNAIANAESGTLYTEGVFKCGKAAVQIARGDNLFVDLATGLVVTNVATDDYVRCGVAAAAAASGAAYVDVELNATVTAGKASSAIDSGDASSLAEQAAAVSAIVTALVAAGIVRKN